jgi:hypothetical protein
LLQFKFIYSPYNVLFPNTNFLQIEENKFYTRAKRKENSLYLYLGDGRTKDSGLSVSYKRSYRWKNFQTFRMFPTTKLDCGIIVMACRVMTCLKSEESAKILSQFHVLNRKPRAIYHCPPAAPYSKIGKSGRHWKSGRTTNHMYCEWRQ